MAVVCEFAEHLSQSNGGGRTLDVDATATPQYNIRSFFAPKGPLAGPGAAGRWTDAATGDIGDLLDLIRLRCDCRDLHQAMAEARDFLSLPPPLNPATHDQADHGLLKPRTSTTEAARRLFAASRPLDGTLAETYLRSRGLVPGSMPALRFHPAVLCRDDESASPRRLPAMVAAVTDNQGRITGVQRTWLAADGHGLARLPSPRRALGQLLGHGVRFGPLLLGAPHQLIAGEGIETVLSVHSALPDWYAVAALSAAHLAAFEPPSELARLAFTTSRKSVVRGRPGVRGTGSKGAMTAHSASVTSLEYRSSFR